VSNTYTQIFGGNTIFPSDVSYLALALTADTELAWPLESGTLLNPAARIIDITPTGAFSIILPPADQTAVGQTILFNNLGPNTVTVKDNAGGTIVSIAQGLQFQCYISDNTTAAGVWEAFQYGAATAQAQAALLAGFGLIATGATLSQSTPVTLFNSSYTTGSADRSAMFVWTGASGTFTLPTASGAGNDWFVSVRNGGTGNLVITPQGADLINGAATLTLAVGDSATVVTDGTSFFTLGLGQNPVFAFDFTSINLAGESGNYQLTGAELNRIAYQFTGALAGNVEVVVPSTTQQYWVYNDTTGGSFTLRVRTSAQTPGILVARGSRAILYSDGSEVVDAETGGIATPVAVADGGTGSTSAGGALINLGGTTVGIAVFTAAAAVNAWSALGVAPSGTVNGGTF
jgi:hypothetical protein